MKKLSLSWILITATIVSMYLLSYLYLRMDHHIVDYHTWGYADVHEVMTVMPEGPSVFMAAVMSGEDPKEIMQRIVFRVKVIDAIYYPLRKLEESYWCIAS